MLRLRNNKPGSKLRHSNASGNVPQTITLCKEPVTKNPALDTTENLNKGEYCFLEGYPESLTKKSKAYCKYLEFRRGGLFGYEDDESVKRTGFFCIHKDRRNNERQGKLGDCQELCLKCEHYSEMLGDVPNIDLGPF